MRVNEKRKPKYIAGSGNKKTGSGNQKPEMEVKNKSDIPEAEV